MSSWQEVSLGDLAIIQTGPFGSQLHAEDYVQDGVPSIMPQNIGNNRVDTTDIARISYEDAKRLEKYCVAKGDVVFSRRGDVRRRTLIRDRENGWLCGTGCLRVRFNDTKETVHPEFASYYLGLPGILDWIEGNAVGTTMANLNSSILKDLPFVLPSFDEQVTIAEILTSLDEKIELNRKQNRTLEAIAQALFKRWFVEFEFPDENGRPYKSSGGAMQPSELGEIPVGWDVGCIGDFVEHSKDGVNPGDRPEDAFYHFSIPNFDDGQTAKAELGSTILSNKFAVVPDSILVSKLNPRFPRIWPVLNLSSELSVCSTEFQVLLPAVDSYGFVLELLRSPYVTSEMVTRASGTSGSHQRINPDDLLSIEIIKPRQVLVEKFHSVVFDGIVKNQANLEHSRNLAKLRDTLLPKLMSGELRVA